VPLDGRQAATAIDHWTQADPPVTGVCAYNDEVAFAVLGGMRHRMLRAPADLAVIGVDDVPTSPVADPPLTSVRMDESVEGRYIAGCVVAALAGKTMPRSPGANAIKLIVRDSA
jgi:DNA-binding LacI/PurR family transcriptional regulator